VAGQTGKPFDEADRRLIVHGPDEVDLVNSGLEETMIGAT
jgi:glutamate dehydrogenase (NAD(P)+)